MNEPLHSTIEAVGGVVALAMATLLLRGSALEDRPYLEWVAASLIAQGVLDIVHAITPPGATFYWTRTVPTVLGALLFALVWLPRRRVPILPAVVLGIAVTLGILLVAAPNAWPSAFERGFNYRPWAQHINQVAGAGFVAAAVFMLREQRRRGSFIDAVFASYAVLLALAALMFGFSQPWDGTWWAFHVLRFTACVVSLGTVVDLLQRRQRLRLEQLNSDLGAAQQEAERERETLRAVIMQAPIPMALYAKEELRVVLANDAYIAVTGDRDVRGKPLLEAVPELRHRPTFHVIQDALATGEVRTLPEYVAPLRDADGVLRDRYFTATYQPMNIDDETRGVIVVGMDITEQVQARRVAEQFGQRMSVLVQASRAFTQAGLDRAAIFEAVVQQVVEHSFDSAALHVIDRAAKQVRLVALRHRDPDVQAGMQAILSEPFALGEGIAGRVAQTGISVLTPAIDRAALAGTMRPEHVRFIEEHPVKGFVTVAVRARGEILGTLSVTRFVDEPRLGEDDKVLLEDLAGRAGLAIMAADQFTSLQQSLRFADQFVGMLGHDLRNPLNAITVGAALVREKGGESVKVNAERILRSAKRMSAMVSQLLDLTRVRLGEGITLAREQINLAETLDTIIGELELLYPGREIRRKVEGNTTGMWDGSRMAQVIANLLGNALQHGDSAAPVEARIEGTSTGVRITIHNAGEPIQPDIMPVLFDAYRRTDARSHRSEGLGLGLSISQQIVMAHGGTIAARSTKTEGTTFTIELPRPP
ncbi:MAG TPA: ATP-binding protein [Kofleriaceae bacterium]|nr:ATP-binding protein [Kofleriaceae bacterium]